MRATTAIFDVISFVGAGMTSKTVVTKPDVRKSGPSNWTLGALNTCRPATSRPRKAEPVVENPQDCFGGGDTADDSVTLVTE